MDTQVQKQNASQNSLEETNTEKNLSSSVPPAPPKAILAKRLEETLRYETQLKIKVAGLQRVIEDKESELQHKVERLTNEIHATQKERNLLVERIRQYEERNAALTSQFNELYQYCETVYQDAEKRRKEIELRYNVIQSNNEDLEAQLNASNSIQEQLKTENSELQNKIAGMNVSLKEKTGQRASSLSALERGKECIESAVRTLEGFHTSFHSYLDSIEKNGFTPVSQRTGRLFLEHWNIERDNLSRVSTLLSELLEASKKSADGSCPY